MNTGHGIAGTALAWHRALKLLVSSGVLGGIRGYTPYTNLPGPILSVFPALIVLSELKSVHPGFPVAFIL